MSSNLLEGIRHGDLNGCIFEMVSLDDFKPKMGEENEVIVATFYCREDRVADDLKRFLEKSHTKILDAEVSPNPDSDNRYLVFVEIERSEEFFERFDSLLREVDRTLGKKGDWKIRPYLADGALPYTDEVWKDYVITDPNSYMTKEEFEEKMRMAVLGFFNESLFDSVVLEDTEIKIGKFGRTKTYIYEGVVSDGEAAEQYKNERLSFIPDDFMEKSLGADVSLFSSNHRHYIYKNGEVLVLGRVE